MRRVLELLEGALLGVPAEPLPPELEAELPFAVLQDMEPLLSNPMACVPCHAEGRGAAARGHRL